MSTGTVANCKRQVIERSIIAYRRRNWSNAAIAKALGIPMSSVAQLAHQLIRAGKVTPQQEREPFKHWHSPLVKKIVSMWRQRAPTAEIGRAVHRTGAGVCYALQQIKLLHGQQWRRLSPTAWTIKEVAQQLGHRDIGTELISQLCRRGEIPCRRRGHNARGAYLLERAGIAALKRHPLVTDTWICTACGKPFRHHGNRRRYRKPTCSDACQKKYNRRLYLGYRGRPPTTDTRPRWTSLLYQHVRQHTRPPNDQWLTVTQAAAVCGLSVAQVGWLGYRRVVTIHFAPKRWRQRRKMRLYSASEMRLVKRVAALFQKKQHDKKSAGSVV